MYRIVKPSEAHFVTSPGKTFVASADPNISKKRWYLAIPIFRNIRKMDLTIKELILSQETIEKSQARYNVKSSVNTTNNLIYSNMELTTGKHVIELVPKGGYFVLNTLTIHYYVDPTPDEDCIPDTVYLPSDPIIIHDTVYQTKIDTVYKIPDPLYFKIFMQDDSLYLELN